MVKSIVEDLRSVAQKCTRLARDSSRADLSHALEELGVELMAKAAELERNFDK